MCVGKKGRRGGVIIQIAGGMRTRERGGRTGIIWYKSMEEVGSKKNSTRVYNHP